MLTIDKTLAQQIVNTVKDVCGHNINFIDPTGIIFASTNKERIGTYHEIGKKAALTGTVIEVMQDNDFSGTQCGINLPIFHRREILAVIGITGDPPEVRKYVHLAERITHLLIREREIAAFSRNQADKKHYLIDLLLRSEPINQEYFRDCLREFGIDSETRKRLILIRVDTRYSPKSFSILETEIQQLFTSISITLYTFYYPNEYFAVIDETVFLQNEWLLKKFSAAHRELLKLGIGKHIAFIGWQIPVLRHVLRSKVWKMIRIIMYALMT